VEAGKLSLHPDTGKEVADTEQNLHGKPNGVFWTETIHLMDAPLTVAWWASQLKSGEISATWFYGWPSFFDDDKSRAIYATILNRLFAPVNSELGPRERQG
jgi:hypothetical protein